MSAPIRPEIPTVEGVKDAASVPILEALKTVVEMITGRTPNRALIKKLGAGATLGATVTKVNEIIDRLQL